MLSSPVVKSGIFPYGFSFSVRQKVKGKKEREKERKREVSVSKSLLSLQVPFSTYFHVFLRLDTSKF